MPPTSETERLAQVAYWYYVQELSQDAIAVRIGVSRSNVSRMLRTARERQIVRFDIRYPLALDNALEQRITDRFTGTGTSRAFLDHADPTGPEPEEAHAKGPPASCAGGSSTAPGASST